MKHLKTYEDLNQIRFGYILIWKSNQNNSYYYDGSDDEGGSGFSHCWFVKQSQFTPENPTITARTVISDHNGTYSCYTHSKLDPKIFNYFDV
jgi:hypothetical protein